MGIKLARTREFDGKMLSSFKHERDRIEQLMAAAPSAASAAQNADWRRVADRRRRRQGQLSRTAKRGAPGAKPSATRMSSAVAP
jgi:septal ring factor EnvC (AmiA/AmiB activator)